VFLQHISLSFAVLTLFLFQGAVPKFLNLMRLDRFDLQEQAVRRPFRRA
jgi:hypothetical protein